MSVESESRIRLRKVALPALRSTSTSLLDSSATLTKGRWICSMATAGVIFGERTRWAMAANRSAPTPIRTSGSNWAKCGSSATTRAKDFSSRPIRSENIPARSLNARYCKSRAKSRSRASSRARSSSSSTSPEGRSLAALRSRRVAATTKNSVV